MPEKRFINITECPRDAMQGWPRLIATEKKIEYLQSLLTVGFQTLDFGSFVSAKAIPQMADTKEVISALPSENTTKLLAITANFRGAAEAVQYENISKIGFPFSLSETFQLRNTNTTISNAFNTVRDLQELCLKNRKTLVVYLSMGFGNPYGDAYSNTLVRNWIEKFISLDIADLSIADTVGIAKAEDINDLLTQVVQDYPELRLGVHLHADKSNMTEKIDAALDAGCSSFDSAIRGIGGCPMSGSELVGNMDTEVLITHLLNKGYATSVNDHLLRECSRQASEIFV